MFQVIYVQSFFILKSVKIFHYEKLKETDHFILHILVYSSDLIGLVLGFKGDDFFLINLMDLLRNISYLAFSTFSTLISIYFKLTG